MRSTLLVSMALGALLTLGGGRPAAAQLLPPAPDPPSFSAERGFYTQPFQVTLSAAPGLRIRYTTDASTPSATNGTDYTGPIPIETTTPLRAVVLDQGAATSAVVTHTYVFLDKVLQQTNRPPGYPTTFAASDANGRYPADYEMDRQVVGNQVYKDRMLPALQAIPSVSLVTDIPNLFDEATGIYYNPSELGAAWERPVSVEWLEPSGQNTFGINAGMRIHGQSSRRPYRTPKKSFRLYFRADYGPTKLGFPVFAGMAPALAQQDAVQSFDLLLLKGGNNQTWPYYSSRRRQESDYVADEFARLAFRQMGHLAPHGGRYVHLYLNGLYWGLYDTTERVDAKFFAAYLGTAETDLDLINPDENAEPRYAPTADLGTMDAWVALMDLAGGSVTSDAKYQEVQALVDVVNLVDYIILIHYVANGDWPAHNWFAFRHRTGADTRFRFIPWDNEDSFYSVSRDITQADAEASPAHLFMALTRNAQFRALVSERLALHTSGSGVLAPEGCKTLFLALANVVDLALIGESARWGDYSKDVYRWSGGVDSPTPAYLYTRDDFWVPVRDKKLAEYCPQRAGILVEQYVANGWADRLLQAPSYSQYGGTVPAGFSLGITNPNPAGQVFYTLDGSDPRQQDGSVAPGAVANPAGTPVPIPKVTTVTARIQDGTQWSPPSQSTFYVQQDFTPLLINEIHYHPADDGTLLAGSQDFLELHNRGSAALELEGVSFGRGVSFTFPRGSAMEAGAYLVLAADTAAFTAHYGFAPAGQFRGGLSGAGEAVELYSPAGETIDRVAYGVTAPWPASPDGQGPSLEFIEASPDNSVPTAWQASVPGGGTPGAPNSIPALPVSSSSSSAASSSTSWPSIPVLAPGRSDPERAPPLFASSSLLQPPASSSGPVFPPEPEEKSGVSRAGCTCLTADSPPAWLFLAALVLAWSRRRAPG